MTAPPVYISDVFVGMQRTCTRSVTEADLRATLQLTGDLGGYHTDEAFAQAAGFRTLIVPGLFTAGMATQIGGSLDFLARDIRFGYLKPVYVGDALRCTMSVTGVDVDRNRIEMAGEVVNQDGERVLTVECYGYLPRPDWGVPRKPAWP